MNPNIPNNKLAALTPLNFPSSVQKQRFLFPDSSLEKQSNCLSSQQSFMFRPSKNLEFSEDDSPKQLKQIESKNANHSKLYSSKTYQYLLDSTTVGDSFKKSTHSEAKTQANIQLNLQNPFKAANLTFKFIETQSLVKPSEIPKTHLREEFKVRHATRTYSLDFKQVVPLYKTDNLPRNDDLLADKINRLKNDNNSGHKVLNVALSKNYILNYKKETNTSEVKESQPTATNIPTHHLQCSFMPSETHFSAKPFSFMGQSSLISQQPPNNDPSLRSNMTKWMPQTLTSFYQKRTFQSTPRNVPLKPKVFDFCRAIESKHNKLNSNSETACAPILPFFTKSRSGPSQTGRESPLTKN